LYNISIGNQSEIFCHSAAYFPAFDVLPEQFVWLSTVDGTMIVGRVIALYSIKSIVEPTSFWVYLREYCITHTDKVTQLKCLKPEQSTCHLLSTVQGLLRVSPDLHYVFLRYGFVEKISVSSIEDNEFDGTIFLLY